MHVPGERLLQVLLSQKHVRSAAWRMAGFQEESDSMLLSFTFFFFCEAVVFATLETLTDLFALRHVNTLPQDILSHVWQDSLGPNPCQQRCHRSWQQVAVFSYAKGSSGCKGSSQYKASQQGVGMPPNTLRLMLARAESGEEVPFYTH